MKSIMITFNQALRESIVDILDSLEIRGYTFWANVQGRGSESGEPHYGSHAWPTLNSAIMIVTESKKVQPLLDRLNHLDKQSEMQGLRAFVWNIEQSI